MSFEIKSKIKKHDHESFYDKNIVGETQNVRIVCFKLLFVRSFPSSDLVFFLLFVYCIWKIDSNIIS